MEPIILPTCDTSDPASLEAWYGDFGWAQHIRKVVLSNCAEIVRAEATEKLSEARIDALAHIHPLYVGFLTDCLNGRRLREQNVRDSIVNGGHA